MHQKHGKDIENSGNAVRRNMKTIGKAKDSAQLVTYLACIKA